jgi:hypothetical protein
MPLLLAGLVAPYARENALAIRGVGLSAERCASGMAQTDKFRRNAVHRAAASTSAVR